MFPILIMLLVVALVTILLQAKAIKGLKASLRGEVAVRNRWYNAYSKAQITISGLEAAYESRRSTHEADRRRATKQWLELKQAYLVLHNEKVESLLKK